MTRTLEAPGPAELILKQKDTIARRIHGVLHRLPALSPLLVLIIACVGFGLERIALALFKTHGLQIAKWPGEVRDVLGLG